MIRPYKRVQTIKSNKENIVIFPNWPHEKSTCTIVASEIIFSREIIVQMYFRPYKSVQLIKSNKENTVISPNWPHKKAACTIVA